MNRKLLIAFVIAIVLLAAGYWYWTSTRTAPTPEEVNISAVGDAVKAITDSATQGVLPSLDIQTNPLDSVPDINPVTKTNPYSGVKTNPFR